MELTNEYGAPDVFLKAVRGHPYSKGDADFSVTGLLQAPQIARLKKQHWNHLKSDVRDEVWKLLGTGVHAVLEGHASGVTEMRLFSEYDGIKISGAIDLIDGTHLTDYKVTSVWTTKRDLNPNWEAQLNLYAWLVEQNGGEVESLTIVVVCRDWVKSRADQDGYPDSPIVPMPVPLWPFSKREEFVAERVRIHTAENTLPCTNEDRWARNAYEVVSTPGRNKKFNTIEEAVAHINRQKKGSHSIKDIKPTYVRCEGWCEVADFCPQWQGEQGE